jgi:hypothetical protein
LIRSSFGLCVGRQLHSVNERIIAEYQIERIQLETRIALKPTVEDSNGLIAEC